MNFNYDLTECPERYSRVADFMWEEKKPHYLKCANYSSRVPSCFQGLSSSEITELDRICFYAIDGKQKLPPIYEKFISCCAEYSFLYARDVLKDRFELGEKAISGHNNYAYLYAMDILYSRFELGERTILKDGLQSSSYACNILKSRFKLGEKAIANAEYFTNLYYFDNYFYRIANYMNILRSSETIEFLELCSVYTLEKLLKVDLKNKNDVIKVLFKKKLLL